MVVLAKKGDNQNRIINQFICEDIDDLNSIPEKDRIFGSLAYIISSGMLYIANSKGEWMVV